MFCSFLFLFFTFIVIHNKDISIVYSKINLNKNIYHPKKDLYFHIYSVVDNNNVNLKNKNEYNSKIKDRIKIYEQVHNNKCKKIYFLPLIYSNSNNKDVYIEDHKDKNSDNNNNNNNNNKKDDINDNEKKNKINDTPTQNIKYEKDKHMTNDTNDKDKNYSNNFEYIENNLLKLKNNLEVFSSYINNSDVIIVPLNYHDILNKHLIDIIPFNNIINSLDFLFLLNKNDYNKSNINKNININNNNIHNNNIHNNNSNSPCSNNLCPPYNNIYNIIFFIYNYNDHDQDKHLNDSSYNSSFFSNKKNNIISKEKSQIVHVIQNFMKDHYNLKDQNIHEKYLNVNFLFTKDNILDINKIDKDIDENKMLYYQKKNNILDKQTNYINTTNNTNKQENQNLIKYEHKNNDTFFKKYKPDTIKNLTNENYFIYNFLSSYKLDILKEYIYIAKDINIPNNNILNHIKNINIKNKIHNIERLLNNFKNCQLNKNINSHNNVQEIKKKQYSYLLHIILSDLLEKYDSNLEILKNYLYQLFKENIQRIKINSDILSQFKKQINHIDQLFDYYNSKIFLLPFNKNYQAQQKSYYIYYYYKIKLLQLLNQTANEIINYYISKGLYVKNYSFNAFSFSKKYTLFNYIISYIFNMIKNKVNINFNYLSPNAFGFSSYKDDISLSPKKDIMITTSEMDQVQKINIPRSTYTKTMLMMDKDRN
ncbi:conserved Plasmodium protein, unknown function [Plasmodium sp. gorilla clade G2]|uniref:conserved Plasmodium protein, unknown function n=1 Tax=Plasmodium sp. gorilla clade G2 TaxID=880535 RepID=UPI000D221B61|nr:conserved Plasmodium protein, unknown function [Plasmodium sp. gorilla clade G2]SOV15344.1 conserved Plasmodium protein, unknown function [Plasmodium sp. gorilla clade G2]